jgi:hypothetical protein
MPLEGQISRWPQQTLLGAPRSQPTLHYRATSEPGMTTDKHYFIEENEDGKFAVRAKGSKRASGLRNTQKQAEALVKKLNPNDKPNVERVRNTKSGGRNQWRSE